MPFPPDDDSHALAKRFNTPKAASKTTGNSQKMSRCDLIKRRFR
jgi:hypothetical protein